MIQKIKTILRDPMMQKRIGFTILILALFRVLANIPIPSITTFDLERLLAGNQFFGLLNIFAGGGISNFSIAMLGVGPYITASIIMQLFTMMIPKMKMMLQEEGEAGRLKLSTYSRLLSVPLGILQSIGFLLLLQSQGVIGDITIFTMVVSVIVITAGSVLLMWLGELISEFGIGNGVSMIIFAGIVSSLPRQVLQFIQAFNPANIPTYVAFLAITLAVIAIIVTVTEAERPVPVTYAKQVRGNKVYGGVSTYLPLRLNQAGVIPIIFALSILLFPQMIANFLAVSTNPILSSVADKIALFLANPWAYGSAYFVLVFLFTYFYTAVTFDPHRIAENLQKSGAFIPGVRPGDPTVSYLGKVVTRITMVGAIFLGVVAVLPVVMQGVTGNNLLVVGGTSMLIVVSVVLDLLKKIDAQATMREY